MRSLAQEHPQWIADPGASPLFACRQEAGCGVYHAAAPLLHEAGYFHSFQSYRAILQELVIDRLRERDEVQVLVVGIDGETSARTLVEGLSIFRPRVQLTFVDRCATPLRRTRDALEASDGPVHTRALEIVPDGEIPGGPGYDLVLADCFLKQFDGAAKPGVLRVLASFLGTAQSWLVLREYFGCLDELLGRLWNIPHVPSARTAELRELLRPRLPGLERYMLSTGALYGGPAELLADVKKSPLEVVERYTNPSVLDRVFVLRRARS